MTTNQSTGGISRRTLLETAGAAATVAAVVPRHVLGKGTRPPSEKVNMAAIGCGGRSWADMRGLTNHGVNWVALCDVDERRGAPGLKKYPKAGGFKDFRKMLDAVEKDVDAVLVGTPDHTHAVAAMNAIKRGKHVYCEKPLAHSIYEVRELMKAARSRKVVTQMGNQGHSAEHIRLFCEWIWDGAIGQVTEIHAVCGAFRNTYCQMRNLPKLKETHAVPGTLDWDLWLGPVPERPYHPVYLPGKWRGWLPFGTGCIGDFACHVLDPEFWALDLGSPESVVAEADDWDPEKHGLTYPPGTKITYRFPAKKGRGPVTLCWYDGGRTLSSPEDMKQLKKVWNYNAGSLIVGTAGKIVHGSHGAGACRIVPEEKMRAYKRPQRTIPRVKGHYWDFLNAIRTGGNAGSNFDYGGPLTEIPLLGVIALRMLGQELKWDGPAMRFTNCPAANRHINPPRRDGWVL